MGIARAAAVGPIIFCKQADDKTGSAVATLRSPALCNRALRFTQMAIAREAFDGIDLLPRERAEQHKTAVDRTVPAALSRTGLPACPRQAGRPAPLVRRNQYDGARPAFPLRTSFLCAGQ